MLRSYQRFHEYYAPDPKGGHPLATEYEQAIYALLQAYGVEMMTDAKSTVSVDIQTVDAHRCRIEICFMVEKYFFWCFKVCLDKDRHKVDDVQHWSATVRSTPDNDQRAEGTLLSCILAYQRFVAQEPQPLTEAVVHMKSAIEGLQEPISTRCQEMGLEISSLIIHDDSSTDAISSVLFYRFAGTDLRMRVDYDVFQRQILYRTYDMAGLVSILDTKDLLEALQRIQHSIKLKSTPTVTESLDNLPALIEGQQEPISAMCQEMGLEIQNLSITKDLRYVHNSSILLYQFVGTDLRLRVNYDFLQHAVAYFTYYADGRQASTVAHSLPAALQRIQKTVKKTRKLATVRPTR